MTSTPMPDLAVGFAAEYKLAILAEYDAAEADSSKCSTLRLEGLHSSQIVEWRWARDDGALGAMRRCTRKGLARSGRSQG